jgi:hypothetical protein
MRSEKETHMRRIFGIAVGSLVVIMTGCGEVDASDGTQEAFAEHRSELRVAREGIGGVRCPRDMPAGLNPPATATLAAAFPAKGVQIYICATPAAGGAPAWTLKAPHAVLFQGDEAAVIHFAGPSWQALDGSIVTGARAGSATPDATAIPWLLLSAATNVGPGLFADTTFIQRLDTVGGLAPSTGCDAAHLNAQVLVPYRADYFFYHALPAGETHAHQCAAAP